MVNDGDPLAVRTQKLPVCLQAIGALRSAGPVMHAQQQGDAVEVRTPLPAAGCVPKP